MHYFRDVKHSLVIYAVGNGNIETSMYAKIKLIFWL